MSDRFTIVFEGELGKIAGNPFHVDTPFGKPFTVARGDVTEERDDLEADALRLHGEKMDFFERAINAEAQRDAMVKALESCESWIDRWTKHVGGCNGGNECTCGRTAILHEARTALASLRPAPTDCGGKK